MFDADFLCTPKIHLIPLWWLVKTHVRTSTSPWDKCHGKLITLKIDKIPLTATLLSFRVHFNSTQKLGIDNIFTVLHSRFSLVLITLTGMCKQLLLILIDICWSSWWWEIKHSESNETDLRAAMQNSWRCWTHSHNTPTLSNQCGMLFRCIIWTLLIFLAHQGQFPMLDFP